MTVKIRTARSGKGFEYDIVFTWPEGGRFRERANVPIASGKDAARRWAEARERKIFADGKANYQPLNRKHVLLRAPAAVTGTAPTFAEFWPRVVSDHYRANRKKASTIKSAQSVADTHLIPRFGARPLDAITTSDVQALKGGLAHRDPKTVNNVLSVLSRALRCAVEWEVIAALPCRFGLLNKVEGEAEWYELPDYRRLVEGSRKCGPQEHALVLLAGSAGLRRGEIIALKWSDIDFTRKLLRIDRAIWHDKKDVSTEATPKGNRGRIVPLHPELCAALQTLRRQRPSVDERVLPNVDGRDLTYKTIRCMLRRAQKRAGLPVTAGGIHVLRHTFCSHLAIAGVPAKAIQELAGHADLKTTMRYMHLSPHNRSDAMAALARLHEGERAAKAVAS
jgi:integrase